MKLRFSFGLCHVARNETDVSLTESTAIHAPQALNISISFPSPAGDPGTPGGDGVLSVTTTAPVFEQHAYLSIHSGLTGALLGDLFRGQSWENKPSSAVADTTWGGDTTYERAFTDTMSINRTTLAAIVRGGSADLQLVTHLPDNTLHAGKWSPLVFAYPLYSCFMRTIKSGKHMHFHLYRPSDLHFVETSMPLPGGDVTMFFVAFWQHHTRYTTSAGNDPGLNHLRADQDDAPALKTTERIDAHREWPHGYSYLQLQAGFQGELLANVFLHDYTQYSSRSYITDTVIIPKEVFSRVLTSKPNGVANEFSFTIKVPPGTGVVQLESLVVAYPVANLADASSFDDTLTTDTPAIHTHGPAPV